MSVLPFMYIQLEPTNAYKASQWKKMRMVTRTSSIIWAGVAGCWGWEHAPPCNIKMSDTDVDTAVGEWGWSWQQMMVYEDK